MFSGADFVASMSIEIDSSVVGGKPSDFADWLLTSLRMRLMNQMVVQLLYGLIHRDTDEIWIIAGVIENIEQFIAGRKNGRGFQ